MPRAAFFEDEEQAVARRFAERAAGHGVSDFERELESLLAVLGRAEAGQEPDHDRQERVALAMKAFFETAESMTAADAKRYLRFGDHLAERFGRAVDGLLARARREGLSRALVSERERVDEIERLGGSFLARAAKRGVLGEDGTIDGPAFLPEVLFLARWRGLAGLSRVLEFEPAWRRAYLDFLVAFSAPDAVSLRLEAVESLAALDPAYDALLARALVLYQGGRAGEAHDILVRGVDDGRDDPEVVRFIRLLSP